MGWFGIWFDLIATTVFMAVALGWTALNRFAGARAVSRSAQRIAGLPAALWIIAGSAGFLLPVLAYWLSAKSHGNAIAGFLPWNDAAGYYGCAQSYLLGAEPAADCGRRPYYNALLTGFLWLTGNNLQTALLLQAAAAGGAVTVFLRTFSCDMKAPALLASYAVLFLFAAKYSAALVMTENAGLLLGSLALALLWRSARDFHWLTFCAGMAVMAAALNARAGAMLILPAAIGWVLFCSCGRLRGRAVLAGLGLAAVAAGLAVTTLPTLIVEGKLGTAQSNFSYSFYGLVVGGKGWLQVMKDKPEIFTQSGGVIDQTQAIYRAAFESILSRPDLLVLGYLKGLNHYAGELFKYAHDFKPLRFLLIIPMWLAGVWYTARRWRDPRYALLLWLQAGILLSAPFITFDGGNRIYAATIPLDAIFVGLGVMWLSNKIQAVPGAALKRNVRTKPSLALPLVGIAIILVPVITLVAIRQTVPKVEYSQPVCARGLERVVVRPGRSTLMLPLTGPGGETLFPLQVRADNLTQRLHKSVANAFEFRREPGTTLVWGIRLDKGNFGQQMYFVWEGRELVAGEVVGFCVKLSEDPARSMGTATEIQGRISGL